jgi:DNA polymerase-3 subunit delta'
VVGKKLSFEIKTAQPNVWELLDRIIRNDRIGSAYLFTGPAGVGKEAMSIEFGASVNKHYFKNNKELADSNYSRFKSLQHELLKMVFALPTGSSKKDGGNPLESLSNDDQQLLIECIEQKAQDPFYKIIIPGATRILINSIRELRKTLYLKSDDVGRKIVLIFDAHLLSSGQAESANALLKILEEPPQNTTIILITDNKDKLLPTILSRCQHIDFPPLKKEIIQHYLLENGIDEESAYVIAGIARGDMRKAIALSDESIDNLMSKINEIIDIIIDENGNEWRKFINDNSALVRKNIHEFQFNIFLLQIWFQSVYRLKNGIEDELHHPLLIKKMNQFLKENPFANLQKINILLEETLEAVGRNLYMSLILTNLLISIHKNLK